jgi:hypothetical protein
MSNVTLAEAIEDARRGKKQMVTCPAHDDGKASLAVAPGTGEQPVILHCHAECKPEDIMRAAGIEWSEVCAPLDSTIPTEEVWTPAGNASHVYQYVDEKGELLFEALRVPKPGGKEFRQRRPDPEARGGWAWNLQGVRRVLYRLPQVIEAVRNGTTIYVMEGEKDVEAARMDGLVATCNPMGALKWSDDYSEFLAGATVVIVADNDDKGHQHARQVMDSLLTVECTVDIVESTLPNCKDYFDHRAHGGTIQSMTLVWSSRKETAETGALTITDMIEGEWDTGIEIIPGFLARGNIVIFTGFEGHGKTTLLRQIAVCCAWGINPFTYEPMDPLTVMFTDAENPEHQQVLDWRKLVKLAQAHTGQQTAPGRLMILSEWMTEPDLTSTVGQAWLHERVQVIQPDIVLMGPVQNLVSRDVKDDEVVRKLKHGVNIARSMPPNPAFILEHHAPHRMAGDSERSTRPYGSSLFQKWPDFGYGLKPRKDSPRGDVYDVWPNRKPRVRARAWPPVVRWGSSSEGSLEWPWMFEPDDVSGSRNEGGRDWSGRRGQAG